MKNVFAWLFCDLVWVLLLDVLVLWHVGVLSWDKLAFRGFAWRDKIYLRVVVRSECSFKWVHSITDDLSRDINYPQSTVCRNWVDRLDLRTAGNESLSYHEEMCHSGVIGRYIRTICICYAKG